MAALNDQDLTPEAADAIQAWHEKNDPNGWTYEFADNHRFAIQGNAEQEQAYDEKQRCGCCGYCDVELPLPDGTTLLYGFNYGH